MVLLFSLLSFTLLQRARRSQVLNFSSAPDYSTSCVITPCIYRFCFAGTSASGYRVGSSKASELVSKPAQTQITALNMWCGGKNFRVTWETFPDFIFTAVAPVIFFLWHTLTYGAKATKDLHFDVFQVKRDAIKWNLSSARLPTSIYWLTTLGFQFNPSKHVG